LADQVGGPNGLISKESQLALNRDFPPYRRTLAVVQVALKRRDFTTAESLALSAQGDRARTLDADFDRAIIAAQARLESATTSARQAIPLEVLGLALSAIAAIAFVIYGLRRRIGEYA